MVSDKRSSSRRSRQAKDSSIPPANTLEKLREENQELVMLNKSKDEFVAITSHQLRTPATAVKQYVSLLLEGYSDPLTPGQLEFLTKAYESNERMLHIIDDILHVAQLDLDKVVPAFRKTDISKVVQRAADGLKGKLLKRNQAMKIVKPGSIIKVPIDNKYIASALENLLENASNYSLPGTKININIRSVEGGVDIVIKDYGVGIDPTDYPQLFQKFSRIYNPLSIEVGGTGLGLYWAKKIIDLHHGRISVVSAVNKGSSFTIWLPSQQPRL